jgi:hypothetical protein
MSSLLTCTNCQMRAGPAWLTSPAQGRNVTRSRKESVQRRILRAKFGLLLAFVILASLSPTSAVPVVATGQGPAMASIGPLTFGPDGTLFAADNQGAAIFALDLGAQINGGVAGAKALDALDEKLAALLRTGAREVSITDLAVHPRTRNAYVSVMRGPGAGAAPALFRIDGAGQIANVSLQTVKFQKVELPNAPVANSAARQNPRTQVVTDMAFADGRLWIAGLSNEEFASKLRAIPYPFATVDRGVSVEICHGNHKAVETRSPVNAFGALRFTPAFPLDPGRSYRVQFDPGRLPGAAGLDAPIVATVGQPARDAAPSTVVTRVSPTADTVPENLLRMYIEFSEPMGRPSGVEHMKLLDESGREIPGAFLPLDYEFWSPDHTRFTAFFDPGRVKGGILPNQQIGRALRADRSVTLVIDHEWRDQYGRPLKENFRRVLRIGPAEDQPLDTATWRIQPPAAGGRDGLIVSFPKPLDHALLMRALGVRREDAPVEGDVVIDQAETRWTFTPKQPWRPTSCSRSTRSRMSPATRSAAPFEVDNFDTVDKNPDPKSILIPFAVREDSLTKIREQLEPKR